MRLVYAITLLVALSAVVEVTKAALPGGRYGSAVWNISGGNIYLYGGYGLGEEEGREGNI
jgi:hypothetical protein